MKFCSKCGGTGFEIDHAEIGRQMRELRTAARLSLAIVASRLDVSVVYLSDLERGNRNWSSERIDWFKKGLSCKSVKKSTPSKNCAG